jgi:flagellar hook-associated protein 2
MVEASEGEIRMSVSGSGTSTGSTANSSTNPLLNITGLASGLDTNAIVDALIAVEKRPQILLQNKQVQYKLKDVALESVIGKINALQTAARNIGNPLDWQPLTAAVSDPTRATASSSSAQSTGSVSFTVTALASKDSVVSNGQVPDIDTTVIAAGSILIGTSAGSTTVSVGGGTLNEIVNAINSQVAIGLTAAAVQVAPGQYRLQLSATNVTETVNTDVAQFAGMGPSWQQVTTASQAMIHVGAPGMGYDVVSNTNTFANLLPGVNVTVKQADPLTTVSVTSSPDVDAMVTKVQKVVDAYNDAVDEMKKQTAYDAGSKTAQPLTGMSAIGQARNQLSSAISGTSTSTPSLAGIQLDRDGHITFDESKFKTAFSNGQVATQTIFANPLDPLNPGLADRLKAVVTGLTTVVTGSLSSAQKGVETTIADLTTQIDDYQRHLDKRESDLRRQFAALESALSRIKGQAVDFSKVLGNNNSN